jgi:valyl-tRNA synthetase
MIMAGYEWRNEKPFSNVYFTGIVRDKLGRKMSKQLGNSPDPLDLIAKYGADGMRIAMLMSASAGNDVMFDEALCEQGRNFCNKIWNAYRLVNMWSEDATIAQPDSSKAAIAWFDEVMLERIERINHNMEQYRISEAFTELYRLFWDDFSGWYLEMVKPAYQAPIDSATLARTKHYFDQLLRLMHPFMPFVTEEIWQDLKPESGVKSIVIAQQPMAERKADEQILARFALVEEVITAIRNIRKQKNIAQKEALTLNYIADENFPAEYASVIAKMGNIKAIVATEEKDATAAAFIVKTTQYFVPMEGNIDKEAELKKLGDDLAYYEGFLQSVLKKLSNERFVSSAPEKVVANERAKQADAEAKIAAIKAQMEALQ